MYSFSEIQYASPEYDESLYLRYKVLREPLGLDYEVEQIEDEWDSMHLGMFSSDGRLVACLVFKILDEYLLKMRQVAVAPDLQHTGIGTELVRRSEGWAKDKNYRKIVLNARDIAVPFYERLSYLRVGAEFVEVGIPHYKMEKHILEVM
ncbi:MAG: GNAT family N-acetyltransferase [Bacteroidota bacterium]|nr:GNAT family N-acetyltransferase [Bacteroidota bacterium]